MSPSDLLDAMVKIRISAPRGIEPVIFGHPPRSLVTDNGSVSRKHSVVPDGEKLI